MNPTHRTRNIGRRALSVTAAAAALLGCVTAAHAASAADLAANRAPYRSKACFGCDGFAARSSTMSGPPLARRAPSPGGARSNVRAPQRAMPLSSAKTPRAADLARIHADLASLCAPPAPVAPHGIALLAADSGAANPSSGAASSPPARMLARGQAVYAAHCVACHGPNGRGGTGPALRNIAARMDLDGIEMQIRAPAGVMPALYPGVISADDVRDVSRYVAELK